MVARKMSESLFAVQLNTYCHMVQRGKPAASMALQDRHVDEATKLVTEEHRLHVYTEWLYGGWVTFWVYKYDHILEVIQSTTPVPNTPFDHWVLGKLYGYDESSIAEYLNESNEDATTTT